jgi:hypothetical protein
VATVVQLPDCAGFAVDAPSGHLGWVDESRPVDEGRRAALAVRTADNRRALLPLDEIVSVDPEACEVSVRSDAALVELDAAPSQPLWQFVVLGLTALASLVAFEIGLAFLAAYLVTGHAY